MQTLGTPSDILPASLQMLARALAEIVLLGLVNRYGSSATAAYGAATQVLSWLPGDEPRHCRGNLQRTRSWRETTREAAGDREYGTVLERRGHRAVRRRCAPVRAIRAACVSGTRARVGSRSCHYAHRRLERGAAGMEQRFGKRNARERGGASPGAPEHCCDYWHRITGCPGA